MGDWILSVTHLTIFRKFLFYSTIYSKMNGTLKGVHLHVHFEATLYFSHTEFTSHNNKTISYYVKENLLWLESLLASKRSSKYPLWYHFYASPSSEESYRDRQLTTNFEFWVEIFCVPTCFHMRIPKPCLSVCPSVRLSICPYPEKRNYPGFVNISPTLVINTSMERSSRVLHHENPKIWKKKIKKVRNSNFDLWRRAEIALVSSISVLH